MTGLFLSPDSFLKSSTPYLTCKKKGYRDAQSLPSPSTLSAPLLIPFIRRTRSDLSRSEPPSHHTRANGLKSRRHIHSEHNSDFFCFIPKLLILNKPHSS
ncbi:uncharacterized protein LAJ45_01433 [Morchella importuna]|uniref:uncharacterized protein n=1 Tax=Morchella importuna TaxID=1174673 RepID=UPI001E8D50BE|nr:uncharacterized protein LAJ45_01433 [Morchella importuna]KAH8154901.1 hypothetical protein LAJ45_01433 [Morchella importuna]